MNKKHVTIGLVCLAIGLILGAIVSYAQTPNSTFYISSGVYPSAPTYTIFRDGSEYFAKDANGQIDYGDTNASAVFVSVLATNPESIFIKAGTYDLSNITNYVNAPCKIYGDGYRTRLFSDEVTAMVYLFRIASDNVSISNLRFEATPVNNMVCGVRIEQHENIQIENVYFINLRWGIFSSDDPTHVVIRDSYFENGQQEQIFIYNPHDLTIFNNHFRNLTYPATWILAPSRLRIIDNTALDCVMNHADTGVFTVETQHQGNALDVNIIGNFIKWWNNASATTLGISVGGVHNASNFFDQVTITDNIIDGGGFNNIDFGIWVEGNSTINNMRDVIVAHNQIKNVEVYGIYAYRTLNIEVSSNYIENSGTNIFMSATVVNASVHHNLGFITENFGTGTFSSNTSITFNHGLDGTPVLVLASFNVTGWTSYGWSATATQITITVETSGTYECYWFAQYEP